LGNFKDGKKHGRGTMVFQNDTYYMGYWENDKFHDKGAIVDNTYMYIGSWVNGICKGKGIYELFDPSGKTHYEGEFEENTKHGYGIESYPDGSTYEGYFEQNLKTGKGKFCWKQGFTYVGDFYMNNMEGFGTYNWIDERQYTGYHSAK